MIKKVINIIMIIAGLIFGALVGYSMLNLIKSTGVQNIAFYYIMGIIALVFGIVLQIAVHEFGHLIGGLLSGYSFLSFRIFNIMIVKKNGKYAFKTLKLAGTGGQCLMAPPDKNYNDIPYFLYNVMGGGANIIFSIFSFAITALTNNLPLQIICFTSGAIGVFMAATNLIPLNISVNNDGMNILQIRKSEEARTSFFKQMKTAVYMAKGVRVKHFPDELFEVKEGSEKTDALSAACRVNYCLKLLDENKYSEFIEKANELIKNNNAILDIHKIQLTNSKIFCLIMLGESKEQIVKLLDKPYKQVAKAMANMPEFARTAYALARHITHDDKQMAKSEKIFEKAIKSYPYEGEIITEMQLMSEVKNLKREVNE